MNFRRILNRKLIITGTIVVMVVLAITLIAVPTGAINQAPAPPGIGGVLNQPAPPPMVINYQGYLTDDEGNPINDTLEMTFSIYEVASGGTPLWTETHPSVEVTDGLFNVHLGSIDPGYVSYLTGETYLGVTVGTDDEMTPRQQIVSVAYALVADTLDGMDSADFVAVAGDTMTGQLVLPADGLVAGTDQLVLTDGKVGIGTASPRSYQLRVEGVSNNGIYASSSSDYGVVGQHSSGNYGTLGSSTEGAQGEHSSGNYGRLGTADEGVYGSSDFYGVYGVNSDSGNYGILGTSKEGVYGYSSDFYGVYGHSSHDGGYGVYGRSYYGVYGTGDYGVYAMGSKTAVTGKAEGQQGNGVLGYGAYGFCDFVAAGPGSDYCAFTGAHDVKLTDYFPADIKPGLIVSTTGETQIRIYDGETTYSSTLPTVQLADTANDKTIFGVITSETTLPEDHWYQAGEGERFGLVNALGEGRVWVTNINGDIENGDYITTSVIAGYGQKQDDDFLHSYTLGKAIETIDWNQTMETVEFDGQTYKAYVIAVVYTSG